MKGERHGEGVHRGRSPQAVGDDRGRRRSRDGAGDRPVRHRQGRVRRDAEDRVRVARPGLGGRGQQRRRSAVGATAAGRRRARRRRAGQALGPGAVVRHRAQPEDRRPRRARGRGGRGPHRRPAGAVLRRRARGVADARRPTRGAHPGPGPDREPAAPAAVRTHPGPGEEGHHHRSGQGDPRVGAPAGPGREDPPPARGRAARRAGGGREEDQDPHRRTEGDGAGPRLDG